MTIHFLLMLITNNYFKSNQETKSENALSNIPSPKLLYKKSVTYRSSMPWGILFIIFIIWLFHRLSTTHGTVKLYYLFLRLVETLDFPKEKYAYYQKCYNTFFCKWALFWLDSLSVGILECSSCPFLVRTFCFNYSIRLTLTPSVKQSFVSNVN